MQRPTAVLFLFLSCIFIFMISDTSGGHKEFYLFKYKLNFLEALTFCKRKGMTLAEIMSDDDYIATLARINQTYPDLAVRESFWVGGTDLTARGQFIWIMSGRRVEYKGWHIGEPNNWGGDESCIGFIKDKDATRWNDWPCHKQFEFICQKEPAPPCA